MARALDGLPRMAAEMAEGRLSYAKVRDMTRVATPANEDYLLNIALHGTASHVESVVRGYRRALDAEELSREAIQQRDQYLLYYTEPDGSLVIRGQLPAEIGALFVRALEAAEDSLPIPKNVSGRNVFWTTGITCASAGSRRSPPSPRASLRPGRGTCPGRTGTRSWCTWMPRRSSTPMPAVASWSTGLPSPQRRPGSLACDASVVRIIENAKGEPLDVGRKTRTIPPGDPQGPELAGQGLPVPGLLVQALRRWPSREALGRMAGRPSSRTS